MTQESLTILSPEQYLSALEKIIRSKQNTQCLFHNCTNPSIYSHVFQKEGVLREIAENGKVMAFTYKDLFFIKRGELPVCYAEKGISRTFGFYGFCSYHDDMLFRSIEKSNNNVDWYDKQNQFLLGYKTLCRELYIQHKVKDYYSSIINKLPISQDYFLNAFINQCNRNYSIDVLEKYKKIFEESIYENIFEKYYFLTTQLPFRLDLCLASTITISEECKGPYFGPDKDIISDTVNIVNIFPYKNTTVIIIGFLKSSNNIWANKIYEKLGSDNYEDYCIALQDILFRSEFHCMSKSLYTKVQSHIPEFLKEWVELRECFNHHLQYRSNIFKDLIGNILGFTVND